MAEPTISSLLERLTPDPIRATIPFSADLARTNEALLNSRSDAEAANHLRAWLHDHQPCLFGRMATGDPDLLSFCILTERDLVGSDSAIQEKIQKYRLHWRREAFLGRKSGFVILALSQRILEAAPNRDLERLMLRLSELYLLERVRPNVVFHDRISLEIAADHYREWLVGVNFFGSQGDGRWWHDHRIPGGIALSMNSVGHMVRSGTENNTRALDLAKAAGESVRKKPVDTLYMGLRYAMMTINRARETASGRATSLRPAGPSPGDCPMSRVPAELQGKDWTTYSGWYDTDQTIPSIYFREDVDRPAEATQLELDFTYLYDDSNVDYVRIGPGVQTR